MPYPSKPKLDYSYTGFQQSQGDNSFPGTQVDNDLKNLKKGVDDTIDMLKNVVRDDGKLKNEVVTEDSLAPGLLKNIKANADRAEEAADAAESSAAVALEAAAGAAEAAEALADADNRYASKEATDATLAGKADIFPLQPYGIATDGVTASDAAIGAAVTAALNAGAVLDFGGKTITLAAIKSYTAPGTYRWKNVTINKPTQAVSGEVSLLFTGNAWAGPYPLAADTAVGALTITVADGAAFVPGKRYLLISTVLYNPDGGSPAGHKSEYVTVLSVASNTVTLTAPLQSTDTAETF